MAKDKEPEEMPEALTHKTREGGYAMTSRKRAMRGISTETAKYSDFDSERDADGNNDPNNRISGRPKKK